MLLFIRVIIPAVLCLYNQCTFNSFVFLISVIHSVFMAQKLDVVYNVRVHGDEIYYLCELVTITRMLNVAQTIFLCNRCKAAVTNIRGLPVL